MLLHTSLPILTESKYVLPWQPNLPKNKKVMDSFELGIYILDAVGSSGILKGKQKLGVTFNFDKQDIIDFTNFSKMTMCRASEAN